MPGFEEAGLDTAQAVLEECAHAISEQVVAPLDRAGDTDPSSWSAGEVTYDAGRSSRRSASSARAAGKGLQHPAEFGGQGLPKTIGGACIEMINSANLSFALCPLLTDGAIEALLTPGSSEQQQTYIPKMISGEWTGTMNLTEPQAGSDLADGSHARRAAARWQLQDLRHQDLHHLRRARHGRATSSTSCSRGWSARPKG